MAIEKLKINYKTQN